MAISSTCESVRVSKSWSVCLCMLALFILLAGPNTSNTNISIIKFIISCCGNFACYNFLLLTLLTEVRIEQTKE
jgi:hypothetical protein